MIVTGKYYVFAQTAISEVPGILSSINSGQPGQVAALIYAVEDTQYWQLQDAGSGAYAIVNKANGLYLNCDAQGHVTAKSGNTHVSDSQAWYFDPLDNGLYTVRNKATQLGLSALRGAGDVSAVAVDPHATEQQWAMLDNSFSAVPVDVPCWLASEILLGKVIAIYREAAMYVTDYHRGDSNQVWLIRAIGQGCCTIENQGNGLVLESDAAHNVSVRPRASTLPESEMQTWIFESTGTVASWGIWNKATGYYLTASSPGNISAMPRSGHAEQVWHVAASYVETDLDALGRLYSHGWNAKIDDHQPCAEYVCSDSNYRTKQPTWTQKPDGGGEAVMLLDHIRGGAVEGDDHATLKVTFLSTGQVYSADLTWSLGGQWAIEWGTKIVVKIEDEVNDLASDEAGDAAAEIADLLSEGALTPFDPVISKVASAMTSKLIGSLFSQLNGMIKKELGNDDGGRQTFIAVINHNMNKLCASMKVTPALTLPNTSIWFSTDAFPAALYSNLRAAYGNTIAESSVSWKGNQTTDYVVAGDLPTGNRNFSTWKHDSSAFPLKQGLYVSTKIDMLHDTLAADGHYVVMMGFSSNGQVISAQASLVWPPDQNLDSYLSPVFTGTDAHEQLYRNLQSNAPHFAAPNAVKLNMDSMIQCVRVTSG